MATQWQLDGAIFDSETRHVMAQIKLPPDAPTEPAARDLAKLKELRIAIAVTWDRQQHYRVWREEDSAELVRYLAAFPYIVGANLNGFDYPVLERYVPNVRRRLGRKSIDLLTHARWGAVLGTLTSAMDELTIQYEGDPEPEEWPSYLATLRQRVAFFGLTVDEAGGLLPSPSP